MRCRARRLMPPARTHAGPSSTWTVLCISACTDSQGGDQAGSRLDARVVVPPECCTHAPFTLLRAAWHQAQQSAGGTSLRVQHLPGPIHNAAAVKVGRGQRALPISALQRLRLRATPSLLCCAAAACMSAVCP